MKNCRFLAKQFKIWTLFLLIVSLAVPFGAGRSAEFKTVFPKRANYFLSWEMSGEQARELAKWDLVILDMEHQVKNRDKILKMRELNPKIVILCYLTVQEIRDDAERLKSYIPLRYKLYQGIQPSWWLKRSDGRQVSWWPHTVMLNIAKAAPADKTGKQWADYLAEFVSKEILANGLWDGMFFDNTWNTLTDKVGNNLDIDNDSHAEAPAAIEQSYQDGMNDFFSRVRDLTNRRYPLIGLDGDNFVSLDGLMLENFPYARGWSKMMRDAKEFDPIIINANTANAGGRDDYQKMRFGLASALLGDGYYSFDLGDRDHGQTWWYDEYDFYLGESASRAFLARNQSEDFKQSGLWRRDFKQGLTLVNSSDHDETVDLNAEYERLKGDQDPRTNDGAIVSAVTVPANDGLILLRPIDKLTAQPFRNGSFARVFNQRGQNIRNGFFAYDSQFRGGRTLLIDDLDQDGAIETIVADASQLAIYRQEVLSNYFYPFGSSFKGDLTVAAADVNRDGTKDLIIGQRTRGSDVRIFDLAGKPLGKPFKAFAKNYTGGVNLSVGDLNGDGKIEIVAGAARQSSEVRIFSSAGKKISSFFAYGKSSKSGVNVAVGDVNADGKAEVVTGPATGKPEIKIFNAQAKQVGKSFFGASAKGKSGAAVAVSDVDGDGTGEIISLSSEVFTTARR